MVNYGLLPIFLTKRAVYLVVFKSSKLGPPEEGLSDDEQEEKDLRMLKELDVCRWLQFLSWRVPECSVVMVATMCDLLEANVMAGIPGRVERACQRWLKIMASSGRHIAVKLERGVSLTSCAIPASCWRRLTKSITDRLPERSRWKRPWPCDRGLSNMDAHARGLIDRILYRTKTGPHRGMESFLPRAWCIALAFLEALRLRR